MALICLVKPFITCLLPYRQRTESCQGGWTHSHCRRSARLILRSQPYAWKGRGPSWHKLPVLGRLRRQRHLRAWSSAASTLHKGKSLKLLMPSLYSKLSQRTLYCWEAITRAEIWQRISPLERNVYQDTMRKSITSSWNVSTACPSQLLLMANISQCMEESPQNYKNLSR